MNREMPVCAAHTEKITALAPAPPSLTVALTPEDNFITQVFLS